jgi:hypothetical protein
MGAVGPTWARCPGQVDPALAPRTHPRPGPRRLQIYRLLFSKALFMISYDRVEHFWTLAYLTFRLKVSFSMLSIIRCWVLSFFNVLFFNVESYLTLGRIQRICINNRSPRSTFCRWKLLQILSPCMFWGWGNSWQAGEWSAVAGVGVGETNSIVHSGIEHQEQFRTTES